MLALNSILARNRDKASRSIESHIDLGNKYLEIHKEIRLQFADVSPVTGDMLADFQKRVSELDRQTTTNNISFIGRWWSKIRVYSGINLCWVDSLE